MTGISRSYITKDRDNIAHMFKYYNPDQVGSNSRELWLYCSKISEKRTLMFRHSKAAPWQVHPDLPTAVADLIDKLFDEAFRKNTAVNDADLREHFLTVFRTMGLFDQYSSF